MRLLIFLIAFSSSQVFSAGGNCGAYLSDENGEKGVCDNVDVDHQDLPSLQRGVKLYMNYCFGCHSLEYARYNRVAEDLGISPEEVFQKYHQEFMKNW